MAWEFESPPGHQSACKGREIFFAALFAFLSLLQAPFSFSEGGACMFSGTSCMLSSGVFRFLRCRVGSAGMFFVVCMPAGYFRRFPKGIRGELFVYAEVDARGVLSVPYRNIWAIYFRRRGGEAGKRKRVSVPALSGPLTEAPDIYALWGTELPARSFTSEAGSNTRP